MHTKPMASPREAKIILLQEHPSPAPQIPKKPLINTSPGIDTLQFIDQLLDEHFK